MPARSDYYWRKSDSHPPAGRSAGCGGGGAIGGIVGDIVRGQ